MNLALSSSSSSTDLVEDLAQPEASSKDTWYSHCHPVFEEASEDDSEPSFDLVLGRTTGCRCRGRASK